MSEHLPKLRTIISEVFGIQPQNIEAGTLIKDISADSLDHVELVMALDDEFGTNISDEDAAKWQNEEGTVQDILNYLEEHAA